MTWVGGSHRHRRTRTRRGSRTPPPFFSWGVGSSFFFFLFCETNISMGRLVLENRQDWGAGGGGMRQERRMETTNTKVVGVVMVGGTSGGGSRRTTYNNSKRRMMIMMKKQGLANDLNKRTRDIKPTTTPTTTRRHLALGTLFWGSVFASSSSSSLALDSECASCSDSNSSLQPGDKAFRVSNTGLRVLDVKEGKGDQASRGQVGARTRVLSSCTSECGAH